MRTRLFTDPDIKEIDDWFDTAESGGTALVGEAVFVAEREDGSLAGFVEVGSRNYAEGCSTHPVAYLEGWYVDPDARRGGLGARLVETAEAWAMQNGYSELASDTDLGNDLSCRAHRSLGFEEVGRQVCFIKRLPRSNRK